MLIPSSPSRYSMLKAGIHGSLTTDCIRASPLSNCPGPRPPNSHGRQTQADSRNTTAVVPRAIHRTVSSRPRGTIGSDRKAATRAGRNSISVSGQKAGCTAAAASGMVDPWEGAVGAVSGGGDQPASAVR